MTVTDEGLRYIDSDGHILEHPTAMPDYAPSKFRDRIWHIETEDPPAESNPREWFDRRNVSKLAGSFTEFIAGLRPLDDDA